MIVVTTPSGNVGSEVARLLVEHTPALPFRLVTRRPETLLKRYGPTIDCVRLDFDDPATWPQALDGISTLFLVCPLPDPKTVRTQMLPFIDAAVQAGCQHIIYQSAPGADRVKIMPHYSIERHIEASGVKYTMLRPAYFMQNFIRKDPTHGVDIATRHEIFIPAGKGRIALIDARDVAQVVVRVCEQPAVHAGQGYYLTTPEAPNLYEVADTFSKVLNQPIRYTHPSLPHFWYRLRKRGVPWALLLVMSVEYTLARLGKSTETSPILERLLGHAPGTLAQFVADERERWLTQSWV